MKSNAHITNKDINVNSIEIENSYIHKFNTYIKEIPPNFLNFFDKRNKKEEVTNHLKKLYGDGNFTNDDVECVLKRVLNLARNISLKREQYEDTLRQGEYKKNNWNIIKRCQICGIEFNNEYETSLEHVMPLSLGGDDNETNWQLLCSRCNHDKNSSFGISNIDRISIHTSSRIYSYKELKDQISHIPKNYRYLVMERDNRKCSKCDNNNSNSELFVTINNQNEIVSFDNLFTLCEKCIKDSNIKKELILECDCCDKMKLKNKKKSIRNINERKK